MSSAAGEIKGSYAYSFVHISATTHVHMYIATTNVHMYFWQPKIMLPIHVSVYIQLSKLSNWCHSFLAVVHSSPMEQQRMLYRMGLNLKQCNM